MATRKLVGEKIKGLREDKKLTIEQVAENSGLDISIVREIEENKNIPSLAPLIKIARALGVRLGTFLDDSDNLGPAVCRAGEAVKAMSTSNATARTNSHLDFAALASQKAGRHMEPFIINITNKGADGLQKSSHEGEEFIYVMEGSVKVLYGKTEYILEAGDSIYYDSIVEHLVCAAENHARILAVVYTPF